MASTNPADRLLDVEEPLIDTIGRMITDLHDRLRAAEAIVAALRSNQSGVVDSLVGQITNQFSEMFTSAGQVVDAIRDGDFLAATTDTPVTFTVGVEAELLLDAGAFPFEPSGVVHLVRTSTTDDFAFGRVLAWEPAAQKLTVEIYAAEGEAGPHSDVKVESGAVASLIMQLMLDAVEAKWEQVQSDKTAVGNDKLAVAEDKGIVASDKALTLGYKNAAAESALAAAQSAEDAALFDPSNYYTKANTYTQAEVASAISAAIDALLDGTPGALDTLNELASAIGDDANFATTVINALAAKADSASLGELAALDRASASQIRALSGDAAITATRAADALATITPSGASNWAPDWATFYRAEWVVTGNRTLSNPTNVVVGTTRVVHIAANTSTDRTISYGSYYKGSLPDGIVDNTHFTHLVLYARSATEIIVAGVEWE